MSSTLATQFRQAAGVLREVPDGAALASDDDLVDEVAAVEELGRLVDARRARVAAEVAERSRRELGQDGLAARLGHSRAVALLQVEARIRAGEAKRRIRIGTALAARRALDGTPLPERYPALAAAVTAGEVGLDAVEVIVTALDSVTDRGHPDDLAAAEAALVEAAGALTPELVGVQAGVWREALDPDGTLPREEQQRQARSFTIGRDRADGMTPARLLLTPEDAATMRAAIHAHRPRLLPTKCDEHPVLNSVAVNGRSRVQEDYDVIVAILGAGLQAELEGRGPGTAKTPHEVIVHVTADDLASGRGAGWLAGADLPISVPSVARVACSGGTRLLVTGESGEPLFLSRSHRRFTTKQKRAIAARDGGCAWPGCTAPTAWTDVHHVDEWDADEGPTDVDNGVLLCPFHHHYLHASHAWRIEMRDGIPYLMRRGWHGEATPRFRMQQHPIGLLRTHAAANPPRRT